jgi:DNA-binding HxlR family transcriptional regulator
MQPFGIHPVKRRQPNNSFVDLLRELKDNPFLSENELMFNAFGYDRNSSCESNKKYADMLRRLLRQGLIKRVEAKVEGCKAKYFYYLTDEHRSLSDVRKIVNSSIIKKDKENMKKQEVKVESTVLMINVKIPFEVGSVKGEEIYQVCLYENAENKIAFDIDVMDCVNYEVHGLRVENNYEAHGKLRDSFRDLGVDIDKLIKEETMPKVKEKAQELIKKYSKLDLF